MKITIHRGIDQNGGCITEIATDNARILIDLGQNFPDGEGIVKDDFAPPSGASLSKALLVPFYLFLSFYF